MKKSYLLFMRFGNISLEKLKERIALWWILTYSLVSEDSERSRISIEKSYAFRKVEFQKSSCSVEVPGGTLSPDGLSRILVVQHPSCPSNQARTWRPWQNSLCSLLHRWLMP